MRMTTQDKTEDTIVQELKKRNVPEELYEDITEIHERTELEIDPILCYIVHANGTDELHDVIDVIEGDVVSYTESHGMNKSKVWKTALNIYFKNGRRDINRTCDLLNKADPYDV